MTDLDLWSRAVAGGDSSALAMSTFRRAYDRASRSELPFGIAYHEGSVVPMPRA